MKVQHLLFVCGIVYITACNNGETDKSNTDSVVTSSDSTLVADHFHQFKRIKICTELLPPIPTSEPLEADSVSFYNYNYQKGRGDTLTSTILKPSRGYIAALTQYRWKNDTIHVIFLDGESAVQDRVRAVAKQWEKYAGIIFDFDQSYARPDITISFQYLGSWSYYGTYSRKKRPSMNFGWLDEFSPQEEYQRVVLHEFGHALGFIHEHSHPDAVIPWNRNAVYAYYTKAPNNWDTPTVDQNIFFKYSREETNGTAYDSNSIMHYYIPPELTDGVFTVNEKNELSVLDKQFATVFYPKKKK